MGSVSVSSCRCCMFVSCVHPVAVLNAAFDHTFRAPIMFKLPLHNTPFPGALMKSIGAAFFDRMPFLTSTTCVGCNIKVLNIIFWPEIK